MTVLNVPEALPASLLVTYRLFRTQGPLSRETAAARLSPSPTHPAFTDETNKGVKAALSEGLGMGLLVEDGELIALAAAYREAPPTVAAFRTIVRRLILDLSNPRNHDLARALAWFLTLDPYRAPAAQGWTDMQVQHPVVTDVIGNDIRWGNFQRWTQFLGFGERAVVERATTARKARVTDVLLPNATAAVLDCWPEITARLSRSVPISEFLSAVNQSLPVLDEGSFSREFAEGGHTLTGSMSMTLLELEDAGHLHLEDLSDTGKWRLRRPDGRDVPYSHVIIKEGARA
ncbi:hypothetical protein GCM10008961_31310 [Deinococcus knuensis]|uniref:Uncharacterized protein n=1 Tax=Deinococcus knuensis TaxID=1837380 RepID=A0ABQ2STC2_9DEIO|nr:hypothetical protein GCM10008961_31310 [Deinococcus knuensis]